ncbi:MAG: hypothetical protein KKG99_08850 [Bacteroidetes bacterium]|nr:hypothetical protein [Bacteroidota bacterium]
MKIKLRFIHILFSAIILFSTSLYGQATTGLTPTQTFDDFLSLVNKGTIKRAILSEADIKGSPNLNDNFILGTILTNNKIKYVDVPLRYNIYNDDMEFEVDKNTYLAISNPKSMNEICIGDDVFVYTIKRNKKGEQFGYYQLLQKGKVQLLSRYNIVFKEATTTTGYKAPEPAKLERNSNTYYLQIGTDEPQEISGKKDIQTIFGSESPKIEAFIKKEKLNVRKEADLIELVKFINESK